MTKGILKRHSLSGVSVTSSNSESTDSGSQDDSPKQKRVSFHGAEPARVFEADEWDRSPAEVTLRLTYKDVVELRELNVSLVRTGPLMMERTPSRRPTRQRTSTPPSNQHSESALSGSPHGDVSPVHPHPEELSSSSPSPRLSPTYQYQAFASQSLPPLLEDAPPSFPTVSPEERRLVHGASTPDSYFTFHPAPPPSGSPPGLSFRTPHLKGASSQSLSSPSPLVLSSSPLPTRVPSPKPSSRPVSPVPLYLHSRLGPSSPRVKPQSVPDSTIPIVFPTLSSRASVPKELALDAGKATHSQSKLRGGSPSPSWTPLGLASVSAASSSPGLPSNQDPLSSPTLSPVVTRKSGRSLMGWELKRTGSGNGKLGFGLVRKGTAGM